MTLSFCRMFFRTGLTALLCLSLSGCTQFGSSALKRDQVSYNESLHRAMQEQILMNIVRLRYADWPVTLQVEKMVTQYNWEHVASGKMIWRVPFRGDNDQLELGYIGKYSEKPVMAFRPIRGAEYTRSMLTPIHPAALFGMVYTGWPADRMLETIAHSIQGSRNAQVESGFELKPDPRFALFLKTARMFQLRNALIVDIERKSDPDNENINANSSLRGIKPSVGMKAARSAGSAKKETPNIKTPNEIHAKIGFLPERVGDEAKALFDEMRQSMGLSEETNMYDLAWGTVPPDDRTLVLETRSVLQLMVALSAHVEVDPDEVEEGRVSRLRARPKEDASGLGPLIQIHRGLMAPRDAHTSCRYRGRSYWIADTDLNSKTTFTYLTLLLTLSESADQKGSPLVITNR